MLKESTKNVANRSKEVLVVLESQLVLTRRKPEPRTRDGRPPTLAPSRFIRLSGFITGICEGGRVGVCETFARRGEAVHVGTAWNVACRCKDSCIHSSLFAQSSRHKSGHSASFSPLCVCLPPLLLLLLRTGPIREHPVFLLGSNKRLSRATN